MWVLVFTHHCMQEKLIKKRGCHLIYCEFKLSGPVLFSLHMTQEAGTIRKITHNKGPFNLVTQITSEIWLSEYPEL